MCDDCIITVSIAERKPPLFHMNAMSALYHIAQNDPPKLMRPENWSEIFIDFISVCLKKEPEERPTSSVLFEVSVEPLRKDCLMIMQYPRVDFAYEVYTPKSGQTSQCG